MTRMTHLEELLSPEDINGAIIEIDTFICELCEYGDRMDKLTEPQKVILFNQNLEREVNNGGFDQYFLNSSGDFAHETLGSLEAIGADKTAAILQKAIDQFPSAQVPKDRDERNDVRERIEEQVGAVWEDLDQKFFAYEDDLNTLNIAYVKANKSGF
ncbi:MAG: DMP19 family protein [Flavobacteriales bacterium]|nr:DMP19 family protein [Flavobacteriales bacterium]